MVGRNVDVVLDGLVGCNLIRRDHRGHLAGRIAQHVDVVAVSGICRIGFSGFHDQAVGMDVDGIGGKHLVHHCVAAMRVLGVGRRRRQMIHQTHAQVVAGVKLQANPSVGRNRSRVIRTDIPVGNRGLAHLKDPRSRLELAEPDCLWLGNDQKIEHVVGTREGGWIEGVLIEGVSAGLGIIVRHCASASARQRGENNAPQRRQAERHSLHR